MVVEGIMLTEIIQTEKDIYCMVSLIHNNLKKHNKQTKQNRKQTHRNRDQKDVY